jgi:hypothetical protein
MPADSPKEVTHVHNSMVMHDTESDSDDIIETDDMTPVSEVMKQIDEDEEGSEAGSDNSTDTYDLK